MKDSSLAGLRILVAEDDFLIAYELCEGLVEAGAQVVGPAGTMGELMGLIKDRSVDGAVLDIKMRGLSVFPAVDVLVLRGIPIVFATGYDRGSIPRGYHGISHCEKPVEMQEVTEELRRLCATEV